MHKSWMWKQRSYREQFQGDESNGGAGGAGDTQLDDGTGQPEDETFQDDQHQEGGDAAQGQGAAEDDEVVITIGDEAPPAPSDDEIEGKPAPQWLKDLRKSDREKSKRIRELEQAAVTREAAAAPAAQSVGEKPTLESCDYDGEAYAEKLVAWNDRKRAADAQAETARQEQEAAQASWNARLTAYNTAKATLKVDDFDGAEHLVRETMSPVQQSVILNGADKPELLVYALGRNPAKAKELAAIKDPVKFAFAVAKLETQLKVAPRKAPPAPERQVRGTAGGATGVDNTLARLEAEADRTGDRTKVAAYRREQRNKAA
jgi:hypothetical protein